MSSGVNVREIHALDDLRAALNRFRSEAGQALRAADQDIQRTLAWLAERQTFWQREVRRCQEMLRQAQAALRHCQSQAHYDRETGRTYRPDCSAFEAQVVRAGRALAEAQANLQNVLRWRRTVEQAANDYQREARRLVTQLNSDAPKAVALLGRKITDLQNYLSIRDLSGTPVSTTTSSSATSGTGPTWRIGGTSVQVVSIGEALDRLNGCEVGQEIANDIQAHGTEMRFGATGPDSIAHFSPDANEIVITEELQSASGNVLAAHLAHEGTHVQWTRTGHEANSVDEEYHAFSDQAAVWNAVKDDDIDPQCDWVSGMIRQGKTRAKMRIGELYPDLPEFS